MSACRWAGDDTLAAVGPGGRDGGARARGGVREGDVRKDAGVEAIAAARLELGESRILLVAQRIR